MTFECSGSSRGMVKYAHHETSARQLLTSYAQVVEHLSVAAPELRHLVVGHMYDLIALVRNETQDAAETGNGLSAREARLHAIKTDILASLSQHGLTLTEIALRHGVSPRSVQKLFESEGLTFSQFLLDQRLTRAHRMVSDPRFAGRTISTIAYDAGFSDLSHFNRTFRRRFGKSPSKARAAALCNGGSRLSQIGQNGGGEHHP
jgi:AraC-like DNA-binding protein